MSDVEVWCTSGCLEWMLLALPVNLWTTFWEAMHLLLGPGVISPSLRNFFLKSWQPDRCGFNDVRDLRSGCSVAHCVVHGIACPVPKPDFLIGSPECKDWSLFGRRRKFCGPGWESDSAWLDEIESRKPPVFVEENVPVKSDERLKARLAALYIIHVFTLDGVEECGARRHRQFILGRTNLSFFHTF